MVNVLEFDETNRIGLFNNTLFSVIPFIGKEVTQQCSSIEDISPMEITSRKNEIIAKLNGRDYDTYIKQFWVGLLEGDGSLYVIGTKSNKINVKFEIAMKNLRDNAIMLLLIKDIIGGKVAIRRKGQYVS